MGQIDPKAFRRALGNFATGVTVMTATDRDGNRVGVTANSFNSVSLDPALILWSIDRRSGSKEVFLNATHFAVNVLAVDQINISNNFARPAEDRFAGIEFKEGAGGSVLLPNCAASFECELHETLDGGDHVILVGKVVGFSDNGKPPLLYHQGAYSAVLPHPGHVIDPDSHKKEASSCDERLFDNMHYLLTQAVRAYQNEYYPKQLSSGLSTSEARLAMVLLGEHGSTKEEMLKEVGMPMREINIAVEALKLKGFLKCVEGTLSLTEEGRAAAGKLASIASNHQTEVFKKYTSEEITVFKKILKELIDRDPDPNS